MSYSSLNETDALNSPGSNGTSGVHTYEPIDSVEYLDTLLPRSNADYVPFDPSLPPSDEDRLFAESAAPTVEAALEFVLRKGFTVGKKLGEGSFGAVYLVHRQVARADGSKVTNPTPFVAKVLRIHKHTGAHSDYAQALTEERECMYALQLNGHPNLTRVLQHVNQFPGGPCVALVSEYCNLGDFASFLPQHPQWSRPFVLSALHQLLGGLSHLHSRSIVHRDISLRNVFLHRPEEHNPAAALSSESELHGIIFKLGDFGCAAMVDPQGHAVSKVRFAKASHSVSPETLTDDVAKFLRVDFRAVDVFALAVLISQLMVPDLRPGGPIFTHSVEQEEKASHEYRDAVLNCLSDPSTVDTFSPELCDLLRSMLSKDPSARPTAAECLSKATSFLVSASSQPGTESPSEPKAAANHTSSPLESLSTPAAVSAPKQLELFGIDTPELVSSYGDAEFCLELLQDLASSSPGLVARTRSALAEDRFSDAAYEAHSLKGYFFNCGIKGISAAFYQVEAACRHVQALRVNGETNANWAAIVSCGDSAESLPGSKIPQLLEHAARLSALFGEWVGTEECSEYLRSVMKP